MYGFKDESTAQAKAAKLTQQHPENRYEVAVHSWSPFGSPLTWGVKCYVPYCPEMPERLEGFVWF